MKYTIIWNYTIDSNLLKSIENTYNTQLKNIENSSLNREYFSKKIDARLSKYKSRLANDYKVKIKKVEPIYEEWKKNIVEFLLQKDENIKINDIQTLHTLFFPKDYFWETMWENGVRYYKQYRAWEIREKEEFVIVWNMQYFYIKPEYIEESLQNILSWFYTDNKTHIFLKIIIFYIYLCEIHPFANGNGSIALLICEYLLYKNHFDFSITDVYNSLSLEESKDFFKEWMKWNYNFIFQKVFT